MGAPLWFAALIALCTVVGFVLIRVIYRSPWIALAVFAFASATYQLLAWCYGHFWTFNPAQTYPSAWWGDLVIYPFMVVGPLVLMYNRPADPEKRNFFRSVGWQVMSVFLALGLSFLFWRTQRAVYPGPALHAEWKEFHDEFEFPLISALIFYGLPAIGYSKWGPRSGRWAGWISVLPILGLVIFAVLTHTADRSMDINAPGGKARVPTYGIVNGHRVGPYEPIRLPGGKWVWGLPPVQED